LRDEAVTHSGRAKRHAYSPPVSADLAQEIVQIDGLMGAVKGADTEMDDPDAMRRGFIGR
jgi:hypothetical protein